MFLPCAASAMRVLLIAAIPELKAVAWSSIGKGCHAALQVGYRRVLYARIIRSLDLVGECFRHDGSIVEFVGKGVIYWHAQRVVSIAALIFQMNSLSLFLHYSVILCDILRAKVQKRNQIDNKSHKKNELRMLFLCIATRWRGV